MSKLSPMKNTKSVRHMSDRALELQAHKRSQRNKKQARSVMRQVKQNQIWAAYD